MSNWQLPSASTSPRNISGVACRSKTGTGVPVFPSAWSTETCAVASRIIPGETKTMSSYLPAPGRLRLASQSLASLPPRLAGLLGGEHLRARRHATSPPGDHVDRATPLSDPVLTPYAVAF